MCCDPHSANSQGVIMWTAWGRKHLQYALKRLTLVLVWVKFLCVQKKHWKSVCIKADTCVNSPGLELDVSLDLYMHTNTHTVLTWVRVVPRETLPRLGWTQSKRALSSPPFLQTKSATIVRKSPEDLCNQTTPSASNDACWLFRSSLCSKQCHGL